MKLCEKTLQSFKLRAANTDPGSTPQNIRVITNSPFDKSLVIAFVAKNLHFANSQLPFHKLSVSQILSCFFANSPFHKFSVAVTFHFTLLRFAIQSKTKSRLTEGEGHKGELQPYHIFEKYKELL